MDVESFFDTENSYDLRSVSMTEYVRDARFKLHGLGWTDGDETGWVKDPIAWGGRWNWAETALVAHNAKFDCAVFAWKYGIVPGLYIDTKGLARAVLGPNLPGYSLQEVGQYLGLQSKGSVLAKFDGRHTLTLDEEKELAEYCLGDVEICKGVFQKLWPLFPESQRNALDWTIRTFVEPKLMLDVNVLQRMVDNEKSRREDVIRKSGIPKSVLSSNQQFATLLKQRGITVPTKRSKRTGKEIPAFGLSDPGFLNLRAHDEILFDARRAAKSTIIETRGENLINVGKTGRWPFDVQFSGAAQTHRYSGGDGAGGNPQNFPKQSDIKRSVMAADRGHVCVIGDFSAIELRINAWLAKEEWLQEMIRNGQDVYSAFASKIYKRKITKADKERQYGKISELGLGYGMGKDRFKNEASLPPPRGAEMNITLEEAKEIVWLYRGTHPKIKNLWELAENLLPMMVEGKTNKVFFAPFLTLGKNCIILPSGLKIMYPGLRRLTESTMIGDKPARAGSWVFDRYTKKHTAEPQGLWGGTVVENICQALAGEICKEAIDEALSLGLDVVGAVHDEIIVTCAEKDAENVRRTLQGIMETSPSWWADLPLKAEMGIGRSWAEAKP